MQHSTSGNLPGTRSSGTSGQNVYAYLVNQYSQVSPQVIRQIVEQFGPNVELCEMRVQEVAYECSTQLNFENPLYGRTFTPPNANRHYYAWNQAPRPPPPPPVPVNAMTRSWDASLRPGPVNLGTRGTADSGRDTMSPGVNASSPVSSSPSTSHVLSPFNLIGKLRSSWRKEKQKHKTSEPSSSAALNNNTPPSVSNDPRSPVYLARVGRGESSPALLPPTVEHQQQRRNTIDTHPPPIVISPPLTVDTSDHSLPHAELGQDFFHTGGGGGLRNPAKPRVSFGPRAHVRKLTPTDTAGLANHVQRQRDQKLLMDGALGACKVPMDDLKNDVDRLEKLLNVRNIRAGAIPTEDLERKLDGEIAALEEECHLMSIQLGQTSPEPSPVVDVTETSGWDCPACTFRNHPELTHCEVCEMPHIRANADPGQALAACTGATSFTCYCCQGGRHITPALGQGLAVTNQPRTGSSDSDGSWVMVDK